jgi:hypothetical protein
MKLKHDQRFFQIKKQNILVLQTSKNDGRTADNIPQRILDCHTGVRVLASL